MLTIDMMCQDGGWWERARGQVWGTAHGLSATAWNMLAVCQQGNEINNDSQRHHMVAPGAPTGSYYNIKKCKKHLQMDKKGRCRQGHCKASVHMCKKITECFL